MTNELQKIIIVVSQCEAEQTKYEANNTVFMNFLYF